MSPFNPIWFCLIYFDIACQKQYTFSIVMSSQRTDPFYHDITAIFISDNLLKSLKLIKLLQLSQSSYIKIITVLSLYSSATLVIVFQQVSYKQYVVQSFLFTLTVCLLICVQTIPFKVRYNWINNYRFVTICSSLLIFFSHHFSTFCGFNEAFYVIKFIFTLSM